MCHETYFLKIQFGLMQLLKRTLLPYKVKSVLMHSLYDGIHGSTVVSLSFVPEYLRH